MVERSVCGIFSVHPGLINSNIDGSAMREAFRKYLRANLEGLVHVAVPRFARVLGEPDLLLSLARLRASDTAGQARAFRGLVGTRGDDRCRASTSAVGGHVVTGAGVSKEPEPIGNEPLGERVWGSLCQ